MYNKIVTLIVLLFITPHTSSATFYLPDSGQTKCYQEVSPFAEILCEDTGQDGAYSINPMSYTDNGDGTVIDNNTGLIWQKCSVGQNNDSTCSGSATTYNWYQASGTYDASSNPSSQNVCGSLSLSGHSDWRLPSKKELMSIVDYSVPYPGPTIRQTYFPNTAAYYCWSSTTYSCDSYSAWDVNFDDGLISDGDKDNNDEYVRCVRGGQANKAFEDNGNGTVTDNSTGLTWQQGEPGAMAWGAALSYCEGLSLGGHSDWRLPNVKELESISDDFRYSTAIDTSFFPNAIASGYWSSTTYASNPDGTWGVDFDDGFVNKSNKGDNNSVRCVRAGQSGSLGGLSMTFSGSGSGTVTGDGVRFGSPSSFSTNTETTEQFDIGSILQLHGDPDDYNIFTGWSGDCSGKTDCNLTMTASRTVNAIFDIYADHKTRIGDSSYYTSLQAAYDHSPNPGTVKAWATDYVENLNCNQAKNVTLEGGYNEGYSGSTGYTTLKGNLTIAAGSLTCDRFIISSCNGSCSYYSISGKITYNGTGLGGVSVRLTGTGASLITTDADGNYSFTGLSNGTYTITPSLAGYTITPQQATISSANVTRNFTASPITYSIIGSITYNSTGLSGVAVALSGASTANTTTDSSGNYSFIGLGNGTYTVTPTLAGYTITPQQVSVNGANVTTNFTATWTGYSITGRITLSGTGFGGVAVALSGAGTASTTTDSNGDYSFTGLSNGSYTITPSLTGYLFTPSNLSANVNNSNVTGRNFTAALNSITHPSSLVGTWSSVDHYTEDSDGEAPYTETGGGTINADGTTENGSGAWAVYKNMMAVGTFYDEPDGKGMDCLYIPSVNSPLAGYFEEIDLDYYWWARGTTTGTKVNSSGGSDQLHLHPASLVGNWSISATYTSTSSGTPSSYNSTETVTLNSNGTVSSRGAVIGFWFAEGGSVGNVFGVGYFWDKAAESGFKCNFTSLSGTSSASGYIEDKKLTGSLWWGRGSVTMTKQ